VFGGTQRVKRNFARELCWLDLHDRFRVTITGISHLWQSRRKDDIREMELETRGDEENAIDNLPETIKVVLRRLRKRIRSLSPH
jgi:hypothetical protein